MAASNFTQGTWRGAIAGLIAGVVFLVVVGLSELGTGGFFFIARAAAMPFFGERAGAGPVALGILVHLLISTIMGIAYAWVVWSQPKGLTLMLGVSWGVLAWAVMTYGVAPAVGAGEWVKMAPIGRYVVCHVIFGAALGAAYLPMQRREESPGRIVPRREAKATA